MRVVAAGCFVMAAVFAAVALAGAFGICEKAPIVAGIGIALLLLLQPEVMAPTFSDDVWRKQGVPKDGEMIERERYEALKTARLSDTNAG